MINVYNNLILNNTVSLNGVLNIINFIILSLLPLMYFTQILNLFISLFTKPKKFSNSEKLHNFGYIICAHNEEEVIDKLIDSIYKQDYPKELMHIFVVCDNCTDDTAKIVESLGCNVIVRNDLKNIGKGYALDYGIKEIFEQYSHLAIDAYFVFDADNLLSKDYTKNMNNLFSTGCKVATSYRNSLNFDENAYSASSSIMFLRECEVVHKVRSRCNIGTYVSGTGFYISSDILKDLGGWPFYTLIEDIEFSIYCANNKIKIGYAHDAIFYDEQTENYSDSFNQRLRWCKGNVQCFCKEHHHLAKNFFKKGNFSCFEMYAHTIPIPAITMIWSVLYVIILSVLAIVNDLSFSEFYYSGISNILMYYLAVIVFCFIQGLYTVIRARKRIKCSKFKLVLYLLVFPFYALWLGAILSISLFMNVKWKKIDHNNKKTISDMEADYE